MSKDVTDATDMMQWHVLIVLFPWAIKARQPCQNQRKSLWNDGTTDVTWLYFHDVLVFLLLERLHYLQKLQKLLLRLASFWRLAFTISICAGPTKSCSFSLRSFSCCFLIRVPLIITWSSSPFSKLSIWDMKQNSSRIFDKLHEVRWVHQNQREQGQDRLGKDMVHQ